MKENLFSVRSTRRQFVAGTLALAGSPLYGAEEIRATHRLQHVLLGPVVLHSISIYFVTTGPAESASAWPAACPGCVNRRNRSGPTNNGTRHSPTCSTRATGAWKCCPEP